jgi:hypothetical protein
MLCTLLAGRGTLHGEGYICEQIRCGDSAEGCMLRLRLSDSTLVFTGSEEASWHRRSVD